MATIVPKLTVDDLELLPDDGKRYELIEGELFVSAVPHLSHQHTSGQILTELMLYLRQHPVGEAVATPGLVFDVHNSTIPDLIYVSHERLAQVEQDGHLYGAPELVIEILSPGSENRRRDEVFKRQVYGKFGVDEYWIVDPDQRTVTVFRLQNNSLQPASTLGQGETLTTPLLPDLSLAVDAIFRG